ncbi:MAG: ATPase [Hyphomicrobiaceae bacterium]|nr:ATPase [Hyphomicrobiaceae bacterium]
MSANPLPKRFYTNVAVAPGTDGFAISLDGKPVRTPARNELAVASEELAGEIAAEWEAQGDRIDPSSMPMTKRANTAIDRVRGREDEIVAEIVEYAGSDLLCYRAETPAGLVASQAEHWDPVLEWTKNKLDAPFSVSTGIAHVAQSENALAAVRSALSAHDFYALTPLHTMTTLTGSALLALAHARGHLDPDAVWQAAHVDEDWQISQWGEDAEAKVRRMLRRAEFDADVGFLSTLGVQ